MIYVSRIGTIFGYLSKKATEKNGSNGSTNEILGILFFFDKFRGPMYGFKNVSSNLCLKEIEVEAHAQAASEHVTWSQSLVPPRSPSTARRIDMAMDQYLYIPFLGG